MRIERIDLLHVQLPLNEPYQISSGTLAEEHAIIVRLHSGGVVGYGESCPLFAPFYSYETTSTAWYVLTEFLVPALLGQEVDSAESCLRLMDHVRGHNFAKAGPETAWWDLAGKLSSRSLAQMLGGLRSRVESGLALGMEARVEDLVAKAERLLADGYRRLKIKITYGWDVEPVQALRRALGDIPLMVDANSAYRLEDVEIFRALDDYGLLMIEQPLHYEDLLDHARLQRQIKTPICLDESIHSLRHARDAVELGSCRIVNVKIQRVGGLAVAKAIHDLCHKAGIPLWVGTMPETGVGQAAGLALGSLPGFSYPTDVEPSLRFFRDDLVEPFIEMGRDGAIAVPTGPGLGCEVSEPKLAKYLVEERRFEA